MLKNLTFSLIGLSMATVLASAGIAESKYKPLSVPDNVRVLGSKPREIVWASLSEKEKNLAIHLLAAARAGIPIIYYQNHRHGLLVKKMIETSLNRRNFSKTKALLGDKAFLEFLNYSAKFEDLMGPYSPSNRKFVLSKVTSGQVKILFKRHVGKARTQAVDESVRLLTDPEYEVISQPESADGTDLENSGSNLYAHSLTGAEVTKAFDNGFKSNLNCRISKDASGNVVCQVQALSNPYLSYVVRNALIKIVGELRLALPFASTEHQTNQLRFLISFLEKGDVEDFRQMNVEWVKDAIHSKVDFMMGYVEVYQDYLNHIGAWESYVQIVDPKTTETSASLAKNAQDFEDRMPYGEFKKKFPIDYSPPALMVYYFQEISAFHSGGYNLPNFDDIRRDVGAKNIIKLELLGQDLDPTVLKVRREKYEEFLPKSKVEGVISDWTKQRQALVLLHEIIGHGSGTYDVTKYGEKEDPIGALGALGSALEEQRADMTALVFSGDAHLVKIGFYKDQDEATRVRHEMYDAYLGDFLGILSRDQSFSEPHMRGHWLLINQLLDGGAIEWVSKDGGPLSLENRVFLVKDYEKYFQISLSLLAELQRIKAVRDEAALKNLFTNHAPLSGIDESWAQAMIKRGMGRTFNSGAVEQPWEISKNKVRVFGDVTLEGIANYFGR